MKRRIFIQQTGLALAAAAAASVPVAGLAQSSRRRPSRRGSGDAATNVLVVGAGLGGCAAALALLRAGQRVILTEATDWMGGQLTSQGVPPDEHSSIETHGATRAYRQLRENIREYYRRHYPLTNAARARRELNPGNGTVSRLCHEPRAALAALQAGFAPYLSSGQLSVWLQHEVRTVRLQGDRVREAEVFDGHDGRSKSVAAEFFLDATELGDLLPLAGIEHVVGAESRSETGEPHAASKRDPANQQAFTMCFAMDHAPGQNHVIDPPAQYRFWRDYVPRLNPPWPGRLLDWRYSFPRTLEPRTLGFDPAGTGTAFNLWRYRRILARDNFRAGCGIGDLCLVNWPQNDYLEGNLVGVSAAARRSHIDAAKQLSLSLLYWMQTAAPRPDGGTGWPGLRLRRDVMGTPDGLAKAPYVRESRRIKALFTVLEQQVAADRPGQRAELFADSVGVGSYPIDLHPTSGGDNYIDFETSPFQIPLGAMIPVRVENLLPACKNIGVTHVTSGCYRLHPVEWNIGEVAGELAAYCIETRCVPRGVRERPARLAELQQRLRANGIETHWER